MVNMANAAKFSKIYNSLTKKNFNLETDIYHLEFSFVALTGFYEKKIKCRKNGKLMMELIYLTKN